MLHLHENKMGQMIDLNRGINTIFNSLKQSSLNHRPTEALQIK
jgi:hypothetical protein